MLTAGHLEGQLMVPEGFFGSPDEMLVVEERQGEHRLKTVHQQRPPTRQCILLLRMFKDARKGQREL